jgi:hypothetical protein
VAKVLSFDMSYTIQITISLLMTVFAIAAVMIDRAFFRSHLPPNQLDIMATHIMPVADRRPRLTLSVGLPRLRVEVNAGWLVPAIGDHKPQIIKNHSKNVIED